MVVTGKLILTPEVNKNDIIKLDNEYRLMESKGNKDKCVIITDDGLRYITMDKSCFEIKKKDKKIKKINNDNNMNIEGIK